MSSGDLFSEAQPRTPVAVWLDPDQAALAREIAQLAGLSIIACGGPDAGRAREAAPDARPLSDLRTAVAEAGAGLPVRCVLALSRQGLGQEHAPSVAACAARRIPVLSLEPAPARLDALAEGGWLARPGPPRPIDAVRPLARFRAGPSMRHARDMLAAFGPIRAAWVRAEGTPAAGSLGSRLADVLDLLNDLLGEPDSIHAAATELDTSRPEDDLSALSAEVTATLRYRSGAAASVAASDRSSRWLREATIFGPEGVVRIADERFTWHDPAGLLRDEWRTGDARSDASPQAAAAAESIERALDPHTPAEPPSDPERILAAAHAAVLSARTRSAESPQTILRLFSRE